MDILTAPAILLAMFLAMGVFLLPSWLMWPILIVGVPIGVLLMII